MNAYDCMWVVAMYGTSDTLDTFVLLGRTSTSACLPVTKEDVDVDDEQHDDHDVDARRETPPVAGVLFEGLHAIGAVGGVQGAGGGQGGAGTGLGS